MVSTKDIESQINDDPRPQPPIDSDPPRTNTPNTQPRTSADPMPQVTNTNERHNGNLPVSQTAGNPGPAIQRDENHGDSSDGLWSMYLTEAEKQDNEVTESWKGDTEGILVFTGLFSATVAAFIIESYKLLSPNSGDTTNALLAQISGQLVNISNGTPLTTVAAQSTLPFKPTASAVKVNVLWFLSLILSLNCALSATLMQQWARRYQELAQRRGATHKRGRMRAYIFDGLNRFGMAQAVATMPRLLHISVFLFFAGLIEFLFPIYTTVAYATLGCILAFALAYAILTVLPNIFLNCPYGTPLSGYTWRIIHFFVFVFLRIILEIRKSLSKIWSLANRRARQSDGLQKWRKTLEEQVKVHRQLFWQGLRKSVELSAYRAKSMVVTGALEWALTALDEDKEIEEFAAQVPGFFNSRVVPDATSAVLSLMSHEPNTDPIFGSRLYDLLKTCIPETSVLDENMRKNRLQICLNCLWYFGRAYNQLGISQPLPSYFRNSLIPEIVRRVQTEEDSSVHVVGHCFVALIINKLAADINSRTDPISNRELAYLSTILDTESRDVQFLLEQPSAIALANMVSFIFDKVDTLFADTIPLDVLDVVQQTLDILSQSQSLPAQGWADSELQIDQSTAMINISKRKFERVILFRLNDLLNTCTPAIPTSSPLTEEVRMGCLRVCLKGLWYFARAPNQLENLVPLPPNIYITFSNPEMTRHIREQHDPTFRVVGCCVMALVVNKLMAKIAGCTLPCNLKDTELACLSAILGINSRDVTIFLFDPDSIRFTNMIFLLSDDIYRSPLWSPTLDVLDMVRQTFNILSQALPARLGAKVPLDLTDTLKDVSKGRALAS
ncbi:hypothetical protein BJY52DRAFT_446804 [Lactarius psammicola]|nr:hypothetical protein BJY52DRAFT_446804 [Lactarius psammicola]